MKEPIDVVITWVDGQDRELAEKRKQYVESDELEHDDTGGATRYASIGEIWWCVASINRFAPWVHHIYIVTDGQDPQLTPFLEESFPEGYIPMDIVDHRQIFRGFEQYLPTFNSLSIETMLWRIPGLSRHFIEMNDDFMFSAPVSPDDFFLAGDTPVCYATWACLPLVRMTRIIKRCMEGRPKVTFKGNMIAAAQIAGNRWTFLKIRHAARPLVRDTFEECLGQHSDLIERNIRHRFRHIEQFHAEELHYLHLARRNRLCVRSPKGLLFYLEPKDKKNYVLRKLARLKRGSYKFCCFNNLNLATEQDLCEIKAAIANILKISVK